MCGIAGRLNYDGKSISFRYAKMMIELIRHRGPDQQNLLFIDRSNGQSKTINGLDTSSNDFGDLYLGHARLSIIDLVSGDQPMIDSSGRYVIIFNGEIYNYVELRKQLKAKGYKFRTTGDTEVILNAFREYGSDCPKYLNGMFAFAIYDYRTREIFCARDRLGIKPFYFYHDDNKFIFASEIKAILCQSDIARDIDYRGLADYFTFQYTQRGRTFFKKIKSLKPGQSLTIGNHRLLFKKYWNPMLEPDQSMTESEAIEQLKYLLNDSVRIHMRSDVQIGAHLSGGVDSSAIASVISKKYDTKLYTFTGRFTEGALYDESEYALAVAREINSKPFITTPAAKDFSNNLRDIIWYLDNPVVGPGVFPQYMVSRTAASKLKVVLGGQGGDELFFGYPKYIRNLIENRLIHGLSDSCLDNYSRLFLMNYYRRNFGIQGFAGLMLKRGLSDWASSCVKTAAGLYGLDKYMSGELLAAFKHYSPLDEAIEEFDKIESSSPLNRMSWFDMSNYLGGLLQVEDRTSMAWSLESRVPLLDYRLVELIYKIPSHIKLKFLQPKYIFRQAVDNILPEAIKKRTDKRGFPTPTAIWFNGCLADFAGQFVAPEIMDRRGIFDKKLTAFLESRRKYLTPAISRSDLIWSLMNIEIWFQLFIDGKIGKPLTLEPSLEYISQSVK